MARTAKTPAPSDPLAEGLREITAWGEWFAAAHAQRLRDLDLPADQFEKELAECRRLGEAVTERMRGDFLARTTR